ncbi:Bug family tripartite tricarboxylate transporter substrate binding protein [Rhodoplanes sp. Z2-YC6860]|uniref:Bug family tripartite tricarboxylate transporter substrate binding protein n=1 Tax=Rhodoplanes sp. Z2-YC6860 TaxID=674703 RepID=UPI00078C238F|nr:tripartite tricarboxylate transporter substrate binding protein [Rhodoplanes sp. Z2-YC6860]AMN44490.1 extra-cytoplasmic solute receptor [Rhodoplanes sp. Z2-YC6860]
MRAAATALLLGFIAAASVDRVRAQPDDYPTRNVTFLCPFPAGGGTDLLTRLLAQELQEKLGKPVIVDNRPGAGSQLAANATAKSAPDGYTLFLAPITTLAIGPSVFKSLPYDTVRDFAPIGLVGSAQFALIANPKLDAPTLPDLIKLIKSKNGQMSYGTSGASTPHHLFMEMFLKQIGAKAQHVPYRGSVPAMTDVISGQIPMMMVDLAVAMGAIQEGKVKVYGVTSATRIKAMPEIPTIAEAGLPGFAATGWFSVVTRAGTPRPIIDKINGVLMPYLKRPEVQDRLNAVAITPLTSTPDELQKFIPAEIEKWAKVVKDAGIEPQ